MRSWRGKMKHEGRARGLGEGKCRIKEGHEKQEKRK